MDEQAEVLARAGMLAEAGRPREAAELLGPHLARNPEDVDALLAMSTLQLQLGRPELAAGAAQRAIALRPGSVDAFVAHGFAQAAIGNTAESRRAADHARELAPESPVALTAWIHLHLGVGDFGNWGRRKRLLQTAEQLVRLAPQAAHSHHMMGLVRHDLGHVRRADAAFRRARALAPADADLANDHAGLAITMNRFGFALETYLHHLSTTPQSALALHNLRATVSAFLRIVWFVLFGAAWVSVRMSASGMPADSQRTLEIAMVVLIWLIVGGVVAHTAVTAHGAFGTVMRTLVEVDRPLALTALTLGLTMVLVTVYALWPSTGLLGLVGAGYLAALICMLLSWSGLNRSRAALRSRGG